MKNDNDISQSTINWTPEQAAAAQAKVERYKAKKGIVGHVKDHPVQYGVGSTSIVGAIVAGMMAFFGGNDKGQAPDPHPSPSIVHEAPTIAEFAKVQVQVQALTVRVNELERIQRNEVAKKSEVQSIKDVHNREFNMVMERLDRKRDK